MTDDKKNKLLGLRRFAETFDCQIEEKANGHGYWLIKPRHRNEECDSLDALHDALHRYVSLTTDEANMPS